MPNTATVRLHKPFRQSDKNMAYRCAFGLIKLKLKQGQLCRVKLCQESARSPDRHTHWQETEGYFIQKLDAYFSGQPVHLSMEKFWIPGMSHFQEKIYSTLTSIPFGKVVSYGELAQSAGFPKASRAAGTALAQNPIPVFIPCHRVIRGDGSIGNFSAGPQWKRKLLEHENATL